MKKCPWCGGKYSEGYEVAITAKIRRSDPSSFCSADCWLASGHKSTVGVTILLFSLGIIFSVIYFALPSIFPIETIILVAVGFGCGFPSLFTAKRSRKIRRETPKDSRIDQRIDEQPKEYRDY